MINFNSISLLRGSRVLFDNVSFTLHDRQRVGLVGANGVGKTSLFGLLQGELEPTSGDVGYQGQLQIAHVRQEIKNTQDIALDYVMQGDVKVYACHQAIQAAEANEQFEALAELHVQFASFDGYQAPAKAAKLLSGLGFDEAAQQQPVSAFSGGWRMRLNLAQALMCPSDILLLDEPTNHLDVEAILWLEKWLQDYAGLLILISHDREFLDRVVTIIAHIDQQTIKLYRGNYAAFESERAAQLALQHATYEKQQRHIKHMQAYVDRFRYKASKARQAQSRLKAMGRLDVIAAVQVSTPFRFDFFEPGKCPYPLLKMEQVDLGYDAQLILKQINWQLAPGDRVALLGVNGAGKSTLVKALAGSLQPKAGVVTLGDGVVLGYFAQHQLEALLPEQTALSHLQRLARSESMQQLRNYLGGFGFSGDEIFKEVAHFSGGEKARLALALLIWQRPNLLLLDEPTNHLDMEMRTALMMALQSFSGAMVLVSHDRHLIRNTVDELWVVAGGGIKKFSGDLDEYYSQAQQQQKPAGVLSVEDSTASPVKVTKVKKSNPVKLQALEKTVHQLEKKLATVNEQLNDPILYQSEQQDKRDQLYAEQQQLQQQLQQAEAAWLSYAG